ncbi:MAG: hypothetical protein JWO81_779 [Alphaproteobacteria bacterium]|nr:hypothetical protein [Alphaproteobacteria bacterium]
MPRFYFHLFNDVTTIDEEGQELSDNDAARIRAVKEARELMGETLRQGRIDLSHHIAVRNDRDELVFDLKFGDAVQIRP